MGRPVKSGTFLSLKLDQDIFEELNKYCDVVGCTKTFLVEKLLRFYFETPESQSILELFNTNVFLSDSLAKKKAIDKSDKSDESDNDDKSDDK